MAHVWDAMKKHQAEQAAKAGADPAAPAASAVQAAPVADPMPRVSEELPPASRAASPAAVRFPSELVVYHDRGSAAAEEYRALRTNLLARYPDGRFCMLVTSAEAGEGKTVTCLNLALALAEHKDRRTVVVDFDLRGGMASLLGIKRSPGVADILRGSSDLDAALRTTQEPNLQVLPAGDSSPETAGNLLAAPGLGAFLDSLRQKFDCILLDAPAIGLYPDDTAAIARAAGDV
ncbi:MAG: CpsD/CapB family tyrosine-protein kinase, partial [Planctomycetota bacterium]|nr:CpsD/CapB family tyrosine-protein kinase [Planctomycetota bacterium]